MAEAHLDRLLDRGSVGNRAFADHRDTFHGVPKQTLVLERGELPYITTLVRAPAAGQAENWFCHPLGVYFCSQQMKTNSPQFAIERDADVFSATHIYGYVEALQPPVTAGGFSVLYFGSDNVTRTHAACAAQ